MADSCNGTTGMTTAVDQGVVSPAESQSGALLRRRHEEWHRECESLDKKHMETLTNQWKLLREQMRTLMQEVALAQDQIDELRTSSHQSFLKTKQEIHTTQQELVKERTLREEREAHHNKELEELTQELREEVKHRRAFEAADISHDLKVKFEAFEVSSNTQSTNFQELQRSYENLRSDVGSLQNQHDALKEEVSDNNRERRAEEESMMNCLRENHENLLREVRVREAHLQEDLLSLKERTEQKQGAHESDLKEHRKSIDELQRDMAPHKEQIPILLIRCQEIEDSLGVKYQEHKEAFDKMLSDTAAGKLRLDQRFTEISLKVDSETATRIASVEEMESALNNHKAKLRASEELERAARQACEARVMDCQRLLEDEKVTWEHQSRGLQDQIAAQRQALEHRLDSMLQGQKELETRVRTDLTQEHEGNLMKKLEEHSRNVREIREALSSRILEERAIRESSMSALEDQIAFINNFFQDMGQRYGLDNRGPGVRKQRASAPVRSSATYSSDMPRPVLSGQTQVASPVSTTVLEATLFKVPELDAEREEQLKEILAQKRVDFILNGEKGNAGKLHGVEVSEAELRLNRPIEFDPAHHGEPPLVRDEDEVMDILGDVAEALKIFPSSTLLIEGHTVAPGEKADRWALELAQGRAETVKSTIASFGIEPHRLSTAGLPGVPGGATPRDLILKFTSF